VILYKLQLPRCDLAIAEAACELLPDLSQPEPVAVSMFEAEQKTGAFSGTNTGAGFDPEQAFWCVEAYFESRPDLVSIRTALSGVLPKPDLDEMSLEAVPDENWVALSQAALPPVRAGRFTIHGSHDRALVGRRPMAIEIDAGEAFGTAHHPTTLGCLLALDRLCHGRTFNDVLDLGCGSAVLAIAAAKALPKARIVASDIDPQAVIVARRNIKLNGTGPRIKTCSAAGLSSTALNRPRTFDLIFANILAAPLIELAADLGAVIKPAGIAILSGLLNEQAFEVIANYGAADFIVLEHKRLGEWSTLTLQKR